MKIRFHEKLYIDGITKRKLLSIQKKVRRFSPKFQVYLVTLPIGNQGILEVYWYPELLQKVYRRMEHELVVVGVAADRAGAFSLIENIVSDMLANENRICVEHFFEEHI